MAGLYDLGDVVRLEATFTNTAGTAVDPSTVALTVKPPSGANETPTPSNPSVGTYRYDYTPTLEGLYRYRFVGTGSNAGAEEGHFTVKKSAVI
ncbi:MAG: hypothetical protein AB7O45_00505 [Alphaproteobacteria bacterium]